MKKDFKEISSEIKTLLQKDLTKVDNLIVSKMQSEVTLIPTIAQHIINSGGKRIRPILTILAAKSLNYDGEKAILIAACIEFIHTATLLHDDVVDETNSRRGIDTSNAIWGNKSSILVGDYLFSKAFELMVATDSLIILDILSKASSTIAQGEVLQLANINNLDIKMDTYLNIIHAKTASLFAAATKVSGVLANSNNHILENIANYGNNLGMLFQIVDDILDYYGDKENTGKNIGTDFKEGKVTLPIIMILESCTSVEKKELKRIFENSNYQDNDFDLINSYIKKYKSIEKSKKFAENYLEQGLINLNNIAIKNTFTNYLKELLVTSIERIY